MIQVGLLKYILYMYLLSCLLLGAHFYYSTTNCKHQHFLWLLFLKHFCLALIYFVSFSFSTFLSLRFNVILRFNLFQLHFN